MNMRTALFRAMSTAVCLCLLSVGYGRAEFTPRVDFGAYSECVDRNTAKKDRCWTSNRDVRCDQAAALCMKQLREKLAIDAARDAPKLKEAQHLYADCLFKTAETVALVSSEAADLVREATFAACRRKRNELVEMHRPFNDGYEQALDFADKEFAGHVMMLIIKARAAKSLFERAPKNDIPQMSPVLREPL